MAMEARALVIGHGWNSARTAAKLPVALPRRSIAVHCKGRNKNLSTQRRRQIKRVSLDKSSLNLKVQPNDNVSDKAEETSSHGVLGTTQDSFSSADNTDINNKKDSSPTLAEAINITIEGPDGQQEFQSIQGEDLIIMIKNAEKNIMLLNQARVQALKELDKILLEKEDLQTEINVLETKLAETNARIKVAAQEKVQVEFLEGQLGELKNGVSLRNATDEGNQSWNPDSPINGSSSPVLLELDALRKENKLLKDDLDALKIKLTDISETEERVLILEKESSLLEVSNKTLESRYATIKEDVAKLSTLEYEYKTLSDKVEHLQGLLDDERQTDRTVLSLQHKREFEHKVSKVEGLLEEANSLKLSSQKFQQYDELLQQKIRVLEERLQISDQEIRSLVQLYQESVEEFHDTLIKLKEESEKRSREQIVEDMPWRFWSHLLLTIDGWLLEKKLSTNDAKILREMAWKKDSRIRDAYLACKGKNEQERLATFLKLSPSRRGPGLHIIHVAAEMAPVAKVGGLGDVVSGLGKALQRRGHLVEIILPKYDCMLNDKVNDLKELGVVVQSYFDGKLFENKIWVGTVEGLPVYFIEPHHPSKFFWRGKYYGDHDDFKRFSFFSRAALELLYQSGKKPDIIHCHDWQTAFVAPLYWDIYATKGFDSSRICFTCHNFEYQGAAPASELASCGLDVHHLNRPDRMQDNSAHDKVNPIKGAIVFSNIVTTVSPSYAQEVRTMEGGRGLHETLKFYSRKFVGILNGIDTDAWNPSTDNFLRVQYSVDDLHGKLENKNALRKLLKLSTANASQPLVGCITRLVPQKGVHLIRHAIYRALELGGQFVLLGSSPVPHIQREFEVIASHFENHSSVRLLLKYDEALSHLIYAASDMFVIPSIFEPCGLTQMIAMRYGSVPIVRKTGGLNDSVFDIDDSAIPLQYRNGFTFVTADEQNLNGAMERAFGYYMKNPDSWRQLVQKDMRMDFSWDSPASQYEELYEKSVSRARAAARM